MRHEENEAIKALETPEGWKDELQKLAQKDLDARWAKKGAETPPQVRAPQLQNVFRRCPGQFHGYEGGLAALRNDKVDLPQLINAFRVSYRLVMGLDIDSHGLTADHILFATKGDYPSDYESGTKITGGANDFYKHKGWVMFT